MRIEIVSVCVGVLMAPPANSQRVVEPTAELRILVAPGGYFEPEALGEFKFDVVESGTERSFTASFVRKGAGVIVGRVPYSVFEISVEAEGFYTTRVVVPVRQPKVGTLIRPRLGDLLHVPIEPRSAEGTVTCAAREGYRYWYRVTPLNFNYFERGWHAYHFQDVIDDSGEFVVSGLSNDFWLLTVFEEPTDAILSTEAAATVLVHSELLWLNYSNRDSDRRTTIFVTPEHCRQ